MNDKRPQVVVAGHVCVDVIPTFGTQQLPIEDLLRPGHLTIVGPMVLSTGGVVSNTGLALHRLGEPVRLMGKIGSDLFGRAILDAFRSHDPDLAADMIVSEGEVASYTVVLNPPAIDRIFLHCPGANETFSAEDVPLERVDPARLFHFGYPSLMRRIYVDDGAELAVLMRAVHARGVTTSLDTTLPDPSSEAGRLDWRHLLGNVLPHVDVFIPNLAETLFMLDRGRFDKFVQEGIERVLDTALLHELTDQYLRMGVAVAGLKLGDRGLYLRTTDEANRLAAAGRAFAAVQDGWLGRELFTPCFQVDVRGTTGAGDCTIAGLFAALLHGRSADVAVTYATAVGACSVESPGATSGVPHWDVVEQRLATGWTKYEPALDLTGWVKDDAHSVWYGPRDRSWTQ